MEKLQFKISSGLKSILGKDLITDDSVAVFELIKNSYDAYSDQVIFGLYENDGHASILIDDDGKGMSKQDLIDKWLFVAYSAKKMGSEDQSDYRDKIYSNRKWAGEKGIGRFSCDRLGRYLKIRTTKKGETFASVLSVDWAKFDQSLLNEFQSVAVNYDTVPEDEFSSGTRLEISGLRSGWSRSKLLKLKDSLAKLISPDAISEDEFKIKFDVPREQEADKREDNKVNGLVKNFIFETIGLKSSYIQSKYDPETGLSTTSLFNSGKLVYKYSREHGYDYLEDIKIDLYYLNQSAKLTFSRRMGLSSSRYGHIFLYLGGFRVFPYGEPGTDPLKIDSRKAQGFGRFFGTRDLIGFVKIKNQSDQFRETSSRDGGLLSSPGVTEMEDFFISVLKELEKFVVQVQRWGIDIADDDVEAWDKASHVISALFNDEKVLDFEMTDYFDKILEKGSENSVKSLSNRLAELSAEEDSDELRSYLVKASTRLDELDEARLNAARHAEEQSKRADQATLELKKRISENLFLQSINTNDFKEMIALLHHIGIYAGSIESKLRNISLRVNNGLELSKEWLLSIVDDIGFETKKISNISNFATKANFTLETSEKDLNVIGYVRQYVDRVIPGVYRDDISFEFIYDDELSFIMKIRPIEINIVIDNIISNSKKAKASEMKILFSIANDNELQIKFVDNGRGFGDVDLERLFELGYTTTNGSGVGLYHVKKILDGMGGRINIYSNDAKGVTVEILLKHKKS